MFRQPKYYQTSIQHNSSKEGETIEQKCDRILNNGEPITDGAPLIYTNRKDGVEPLFDPRTDKWDMALDVTDQATKEHLARRTAFHDKLDEANKSKDKNPGGEPTQGTDPK